MDRSSCGWSDDVQALQKAKVDLDIAKTIALSAKSNLKRRSILLRSARRRNAPEEVKMVMLAPDISLSTPPFVPSYGKPPVSCVS